MNQLFTWKWSVYFVVKQQSKYILNTDYLNFTVIQMPKL